MVKRYDDPAMWEKIVLLSVFGKSKLAISEELGCSDRYVGGVVRGFEAVQKKDWEEVKAIVKTYTTPDQVFAWAAEKTGQQLPADFYQMTAAAREERRRENLQKAAQANESKTATPMDRTPAPAEGMTAEDVKCIKLMLTQINKAISERNELLTQLMDVVLPKWAGDITTNLNTNFDVLGNTVRDGVESIKTTIRKVHKEG